MITINQNFTACGAGADFIQFVASGGISPYSFAVLAGGAGGSINSSTGVYTAPPLPSSSPNGAYDVIQVTDSVAATGTAQILVAYPLGLVCDIIQTQMNLPNGRVYEWDQKIFQPTDYDLYVILSVMSCKPFGNVNAPFPGDGSQVNQFVSMYAKIDIDIISRGPAARDQKELVVLALNSIYSQQQQDAFAFYIGKLPITGGFINLSNVDGAAIPYRYKISYAIHYAASLNQAVPYYNNFTNPPEVDTNP